jgi:hypothetical protein
MVRERGFEPLRVEQILPPIEEGIFNFEIQKLTLSCKGLKAGICFQIGKQR